MVGPLQASDPCVRATCAAELPQLLRKQDMFAGFGFV